ncbi:hypothetical protein ACEPAF_8541 [Sanghuangporus sanghuang]
MSAPPIAPSLSFTEPREPAPLVPTDEEEEGEEEEQEMSLSKESITDLATAIALALQAAGEGTSQGSKTNKVHVAKPRDFDSEHRYVNFKRELRLYVYASESEFRTSKAKIMFALSYMKSGAAASWAESYTSGAIDEQGRIAFKDTWDAFLKKLDTSFDDPARSQKAFERLDAMYQGDLNADEFFNKFDICRVDAGLATEAHDEWLMSRLKRALNPKVVEGIMCLPNEPTTYEEFKKAAVKVDRVKHQIRDLMAERRRKTVSSTVMKPAPLPLRRPVPPQQATRPFIPPTQDRCDATGVTYGGLADRKALFEELGQVKESSFEEVDDIDVRAVPTELEELVDGLFSLDSLKYNCPIVQYQDANISDGFTLRKLLTDVIPDEPEVDDDDFDVYTDLLVRKVNAQAGDSNELSVEERNQTAIKNEVEVEAPYRENVVAQANDTEAVWDVVGRRAAEVWHEGIVDADQFIRRARGKELDAFVSIVHPKIAGDDEVDLSNPLLEEENFIDAHALIDSGCTVFNADGTSNEAGLIKEYVVI